VEAPRRVHVQLLVRRGSTVAACTLRSTAAAAAAVAAAAAAAVAVGSSLVVGISHQ